MKRILLLLVAVCMAGQLMAVHYFQGTYEEALRKAKEENKHVFLFFTASWCGPCSYMKRNVLADPDISDYIDAHYIPLMLDYDKPANRTLYARYFDDGGSIPKFLIINGEEEVLKELRGAVKQKRFAEFIYLPDGKTPVRKIAEVPAALKRVKVNRGMDRLLYSFFLSSVKPGLRVGPDFSTFHMSSSVDDRDYRTGYHVGVTALMQMTRQFYVEPGVFFSSLGAKNKKDDTALRLNYTELDLNLGQNLFRYGLSCNFVRLNVIPYGAVAVAGKYKGPEGNARVRFGKDEEEVKRWDYGVKTALNIELGSFECSVGYRWGLHNLSNMPGSKCYNRGFYVSAGINYGR